MKKSEQFEYDEKDYSKFLLEYYHFDISKYTNKSKSWYQQLMRFKRILDDFDSYKIFMLKIYLAKSLFCDYPLDIESSE